MAVAARLMAMAPRVMAVGRGSVVALGHRRVMAMGARGFLALELADLGATAPT